ncbi:hypothetical protein SAMN05518800_2372 [Variovorax sp. YR752]|uniref:hypothetical protein n=1 Tax=unclassified Variovorax TaxID=663243 RepID=UPI000897BD78|nr:MULTISPECIES: hypothetical protein [unclassified Variovorax]SDZ50972.1 hypothetical protein SAMN05518854_1079 [Variovorax sp. YR266]SOD26342.1 hypothetical protein SAMN05518800_2372 [Variovorax sp. YR752]
MTAMTPGKLLAHWAVRPTVMPMQEELSLIRDIRALDTADIAKDLESFISLIELVQRSHASNGIFEMTEADEAHTVGFFQWLKCLEKTLRVPLATHADGLDLTRAELAKRMPR